MYYIYMLRCSDDSLYTGITTDVSKRLKEHYYKLPKGAKYTKSRDVKDIVALWSCESRSLASKLESHIKKLTKLRKELLIQKKEDYMISETVYTREVCKPIDTYIER